MSNNLEISINDFKNICRTCLSRENLKPLYQKCSGSSCLVDMLISCTFVKCTEDDGLPMNICRNCIQELNQAFSFVKHCETTDVILRKCVEQFKTELASNLSQSREIELMIKIKEEMQIEIEPEVIMPIIHETLKEEAFLGNYEYVEVKQEKEDNIKDINDEAYDDPIKERYEEDGNLGSQIEKVSWKNKDDSSPAKTRRKPLYYECSKCYEKFPDFQGLKKHREEVKHPPNVPSPCPVCNKMIGCNKMNRHMRTHTGEKPYCCEICGISFTQAGTLSRHKQVKHSQPIDRLFQCQTCGKSFRRLDLLRAHQRREKREKILSRDFQCTECDRAFTTKRLLKEHSVIHGEKKFFCSNCGRGFVSKSHLYSHSKVHTTVRPYTCDECGKPFTKIEYLRSHKLIHTGEKLNVCSVCKRAFAHRTTLTRHMRLHTGEKPYSCDVCGKEFRDPSNMKKHVQGHYQ